jgi:molybdate transport system ATP-binding protein
MPADGPRPSLHVELRVARSDGFALDVTFDAPPGVTVLFGPSGSGKSTTLAAIAGLVRPARGRVVLGDVVWFDSATRVDVPVQERSIAYVFQSLALFPHMTAAHNVAYGMARSLRRDERRARAVALLERLRVGGLADRKPSTFSGGEAQRVALARALATNPRVVLLDEPFSALDDALRTDLVEDVRTFARELAVPVLFVTHRQGEARGVGQRLVVLRSGRVERTGSVEELVLARDLNSDETPLDPDA